MSFQVEVAKTTLIAYREQSLLDIRFKFTEVEYSLLFS